MSRVQMQRVHSRTGLVMGAVDLDINKPREYEDALDAIERECGPDEYVRTLGDGSPFLVRVLYEEPEE